MTGVILMGWVAPHRFLMLQTTLGSYLEEDLEKG